MLTIINNLRPFFEDCYRRISVREYARLVQVSPPTASKTLKAYHQQNLLEKIEENGRLLFNANIFNKDFIDLSKIYWRKTLEDLGIELRKKLINPCIVLFGSLSKAETKPDSDVDLAVFSPEQKLINLLPFEKRLKRKVSLYWFKSIDRRNQFLMNNIINGYVLQGRLRLK